MKWERSSNSGNAGRKSAILAVCGALVMTSLLSGAGISDRESVQSLLQRRSDVIQMVWYSEMTPEQGERMLQEIETHPLLGEDVVWLRAAEEGMDFSYVLDMAVLELTKTSKSKSGTSYRAKIRWELEEYHRHVTEEHEYQIRTVEKTDGTILLSDLEVMEGQ